MPRGKSRNPSKDRRRNRDQFAGRARQGMLEHTEQVLTKVAVRVPFRIEAAVYEAFEGQKGSPIYLAEKVTGIPRQTLATWLPRGRERNRPTTKGSLGRTGRARISSMPTLAHAAVLADRLGELSLDWLAGYEGMPKYRRERSKVGALETEMHRTVVEHLASDIGVSQEFVYAALGQSPAELMRHILDWVDAKPGQAVKHFAALKREQLLLERWKRAPSVADAVALERRRRRVRQNRTIRNMAVSDLPDPDAPEPREKKS